MTINRNNYEEFFLLYVDNELSAPEKNAVDAFLIENPDLREEMVMLQQSVLTPDAFVFAGKENLLKKDVIDEEVQEQLLLMLDNELAKNEKQKLQTIIKKDEAIKKEWDILQQTKLSAEDQVIFKDKAILYKEDGGRVIAVRWWRIAAAALVIGFGVWGALNYTGKSRYAQPIETVNTNPVKPSAIPAVPGNKTDQPGIANKNLSADAVTAVNETKQDKEIKAPNAIKVKNIVTDKNQKQEVLPSKDVAEQNSNKQAPSNNLPKPLENINNNDSNNNDIAIVTHSNKDHDIEQPKETPANEIAVQTIYIDPDPTTDDEENTKSRKNKIGGFFKKIKRVVERKTNIGTGNSNSLRIANMSFAIQ